MFNCPNCHQDTYSKNKICFECRVKADPSLAAMRPSDAYIDAFANDISPAEPPPGRGLPGERFDLDCPDCLGKSHLQLRKSDAHGLFYGCVKWPDCRGTHGAHPDGRPKGIPGNKATREARIKAHEVFDLLFSGPKPKMTEEAAYVWMAGAMGLSFEEAHIARFTVEQCNALIKLSNIKLGTTVWQQIIDDPFDAVTEVIAEQEDVPIQRLAAREKRQREKKVTWRPGSAHADTYLISDFAIHCYDSEFTDSDGIGYYGTRSKESSVQVSCRDLAAGLTNRHPPECTHVWWYNK